jgi:hypothetical protein
MDYSLTVKINWRNYSTQKPNAYWRGALIAARILRKKDAGKPLNARDRRIAGELFEDEGISNRLIDQAVACLKAPRKF